MESSDSSLPVESSRTLWAGSLPPYVDESFLYSVFGPTGELLSVRLMRERQTGLSQGFAFLEFTSRTAAQEVLNAFDGKQIPNTTHVLRLNWAAFGLGRNLEGSDEAESHSLFVGDLALEVTDLLLQRHFQQFFPSVNSAKVITERSTGRSKGYGFVRFSSVGERDKALGCMDSHLICGRPIRVSHATAKKYQGDGLFHPSDLDPNNTTAFVGNVNSDVTEDDLRQLFQRCGEIVSIKLLRAKGCAFVTYAQRASAERAIVDLHGKVIKNCAIRLCWGRRSNQLRTPLPDLAGAAPYGMLGYQPGLTPGFGATPPAAFQPSRWPHPSGVYGAASMASMGLLPAVSPGPQLGIFDAALQAASLSAPPSFPSPHQVAGLPQPGYVELPQLRPAAASVMPDALQALAQLSLNSSSIDGPPQL